MAAGGAYSCAVGGTMLGQRVAFGGDTALVVGGHSVTRAFFSLLSLVCSLRWCFGHNHVMSSGLS